MSSDMNGNSYQVRSMNRIFDGKVDWPKIFKKKGQINRVRGVLIAGDVTEKAYEEQWDNFENKFYGLCGERTVDGVKGLLKYPVYEGYGNHDFTIDARKRGFNHPVLRAIGERNRFRSGLVRKASNDRGHYSWRWDNVHFINLNVKAGNEVEKILHEKKCGLECGKIKRLIDPHGALTFLKKELAEKVHNKNTPVVIMMHYPPYNYRMKLNGKREDLVFSKAIKDYNVIAIVVGHTHRSAHRKWEGFDVFEVGGPFYYNKSSDMRGHFTLFRITNNHLSVQDIQWRPKETVNSKGEYKIQIYKNAGWSFRKKIDQPRSTK